MDPKSPNGFRKNHLNQTDQTFKVPENLNFFRVYHTKPLTHPLEFSPRNTPPTSTSWWLNQPIWKIWVKIGSSSPIFGVNIKNIWVATTNIQSCHCFVSSQNPHVSIASSKVNNWPVGESQPFGWSDCHGSTWRARNELCCILQTLVGPSDLSVSFFVNKTNQPTFNNTLENIWDQTRVLRFE